MPKTLIIKYLPRAERSHTAKLLNYFKEQIPPNSVCEEINLLTADIPFFSEESLGAYIKRNYLGETLTETESNSLIKFDALTAQFKQFDIIVMAFPMYNFSFPAIVKAYLDAIMLKGETWTTEGKTYKGLMNNKKAITFSAAGGAYLNPPNAWNHLTTLAEVQFKFMGFTEIKTILAEGMNISEEYKEESLKKCYEEIQNICKQWY